jgi:hypothetical protein
MPADQPAALDAQHLGARQVRLENHPALAQGEVANRRQVVEIEVSLPRNLKRVLDSPQFIVLQFQLDPMHLQFVKHALRLGRRQRLERLDRRGRLALRNEFRPPAQVCVMFRTASVASLVAHRMTLSVVATAYICPASSTNAVAVSITRNDRPRLSTRSVS